MVILHIETCKNKEKLEEKLYTFISYNILNKILTTLVKDSMSPILKFYYLDYSIALALLLLLYFQPKAGRKQLFKVVEFPNCKITELFS